VCLCVCVCMYVCMYVYTCMCERKREGKLDLRNDTVACTWTRENHLLS